MGMQRNDVIMYYNERTPCKFYVFWAKKDHQWGLRLVGGIRLQRLEAVADAVRAYRAAMERYLDEQTRLLDAGMPLEEVTRRNWEAFDETMRAEERLYEALAHLDMPDDPSAEPKGADIH